MQGQITNEEMREKMERGTVVTSAADLMDGYVIIRINRTVNYYNQHEDGSWSNTDCKTVGY